ncbi:unnamed protein product [Sphagnum jensenii]|uniref:Uncharacterized protein n=1 Tax=Sphagnum jensenii TaxID=128206 RepID=A0ABP1AH52_9BRYO
MLKDTEDVVSNTMICNCGSPHISSTKQEEETMHNFDDLIWDEFEESTDDMVQEAYEDDKHTKWATENDARRNLQQEPSLVLVKNLGFISQCSGASSSFVIPNTEGRQQSDVGSKPGLQS